MKASRVALAGALFAALMRPLAVVADDSVYLSRRDGTVEFQRAGSDAWRSVIAGRLLQESDAARTGSASAAAINFTEGGRAFMDANAVVKLGSAPDARLTVLAGKVRVALNHAKAGSYVFRTPTSQIAVRGTDFAFYEDGKRVEIGVYEGIVDALIDGRATTVGTWRGVIYDKAAKTLTQLAVGAIHGDFAALYTAEEFLRDQAAARSMGLIQ